MYVQVWRPSWLRAADCLVRSRAHFLVRLRGPRGPLEGHLSPKGPPKGAPLNPLVLLPVCSPLLLGPQTYSAAAEPHQQLLQQRWEETVWQQQQQQQQQHRTSGTADGVGGLSTAAEADERGPSGGGPRCPADGGPSGAPMGLKGETDALWEIQQERVSFRDELFGCTDTTTSNSSSSNSSSSGEGRIIWQGGGGCWAVRALGPPALSAWIQAVVSAVGRR